VINAPYYINLGRVNCTGNESNLTSCNYTTKANGNYANYVIITC